MRAEDLFIDVTTVLGAHCLAMVINLTDCGDWLKIISLLLASGYTVWKWQHDYKKSKRNRHGNKSN